MTRLSEEREEKAAAIDAAINVLEMSGCLELADAVRALRLERDRAVADSRPDPVAMLREWHNKFGVPQKYKPEVPCVIRRGLRVDLISEEFLEFKEASEACDLVEVADALGDILYVVYGAAIEWGIPIYEVFAEIHRSNMTKLWDGPNGPEVRYRADGKVLKPPTYSPADIRGVLARCLYRRLR